MKLVEAIVQPHRLTAILTALDRVDVERLTILDGFCYRDQPVAEFLMAPHHAQILRNVLLEIVVNDDFVERTITAIQDAARSGPHGRDGDGKVLVLPVLETIRIDGHERGPGAV